MTKTKWWLRLVGGFYVLLAGTSLWVLFVNPQLFGAMFPFASNNSTIRAFADAWLIFILDLAVIGVILLYAAQDPASHRTLVVTVSILELIRGAGGDLLWMLRGWPLANYVPFMIIHVLIAVTGLWLVRRESTRSKTL